MIVGHGRVVGSVVVLFGGEALVVAVVDWHGADREVDKCVRAVRTDHVANRITCAAQRRVVAAHVAADVNVVASVTAAASRALIEQINCGTR